ncbi:MAG TPA: GlsB/YeaQ/YmgE family stress response membrane protein [Candidatus Saccharimonadales bacterium]
MGLFAWIILGGLAGWIASIIAGNNKDQGVLGNIGVGIVGALIGGFIVDVLGGKGITGFNIWSLLVAVAGSLILLWMMGKTRSSKPKGKRK